MLHALVRFRDEIADGYALGPVRSMLGVLLGWYALADAERLLEVGYFGDAFHLSMLPDLLVPSHRLFAVVVALRVCFAVMVALGIWARPSLMLSALLGGWVLLCDRLQFGSDRYSLFCYALLLSLGPCDRSWRTADSDVPHPSTGPYWAVRLAQIQVSIVYFASGGAKLLDPAYRTGLVLADRFARDAQFASARVPRAILEFLAREAVASSVSKAVIMSELVLCVALWLRPTRIIALWWGFWFHLFIDVTWGAGTFTLLTLAMYGTFVTPDFQARTLRFDPTRGWGKVCGVLVPMLDWFGRFELKPWAPDDQPGHSIVVVRRDRTTVTGIRAFAMLTRCLPLFFPIWAPVALIASFTRQGDLTTAT
ncbi:hypothetical protein AKJ09_02789 [Labilithrix luteola]|uniref:HTTM-like domain-containing protein n=1 Tax=Labilithrix luteola TaxID=1391654 RepID=A0A0K1PRF7_9BACT|nr:HTTM domain-containing protein [Labilithrix luteola]AKU96125.1 hypothetical protein AKJ09_02789 [Labilithrix luteola]